MLFTQRLTRLWVFSEETAFASGWKDCYRCQSSGGAMAVAGRGELCLRERPQHVLRPRSKPRTRCQCTETLQHPTRKLLSQMRKLRFEEVMSPSLVHPEHAGFSWKTPPHKDQPHLPAENVQKVSGLMRFPGRKLIMKEREGEWKAGDFCCHGYREGNSGMPASFPSLVPPWMPSHLISLS